LGVEPGRLKTPSDFKPGSVLPAEFERAVASSRYTALVLSPAFFDDRWAEFTDLLAAFASVAGQRERVVPVVYRECPLPLRIDFRVKLDCTEPDRWDTEVARLRALQGLRGVRAGFRFSQRAPW